MRLKLKLGTFFTPCYKYLSLFSSLGNNVTKGYKTILLYFKSSIKVRIVQLCDRFSRRYLNFFSRLFSAAACQLSSAFFARERAHALSFLKETFEKERESLLNGFKFFSTTRWSRSHFQPFAKKSFVKSQ